MNIFFRKTFYSLPVPIRYILRRIIYLPYDLFSKSNSLVPPKGLIFTGSGDYTKIGNQFFLHFQKYCDFNRDSAVLDVGCGIGRMAIPFTVWIFLEKCLSVQRKRQLTLAYKTVYRLSSFPTLN